MWRWRVSNPRPDKGKNKCVYTCVKGLTRSNQCSTSPFYGWTTIDYAAIAFSTSTREIILAKVLSAKVLDSSEIVLLFAFIVLID